MLKQKLFPLISTVFLIASCSNNPSHVKLTALMPGNIGLVSSSFGAAKGKKLTFSFTYEHILPDILDPENGGGNGFYLHDGNGNIFIDFIDESKDIKVTCNDIELRHDTRSVSDWFSDYSLKKDEINNSFVYGKIYDYEDVKFYVLLFCHNNKKSSDSVSIEVTSKSYQKNVTAHFLAVLPI